MKENFYCIPHHTIVLWYHLGCPCACPSVIRPSIFLFPDDNLNKCQRIFTEIGVRIDIVRSGLGLLMGNFHQFLTESSAHDTSVFSFLDDNFSKYQ